MVFRNGHSECTWLLCVLRLTGVGLVPFYGSTLTFDKPLFLLVFFLRSISVCFSSSLPCSLTLFLCLVAHGLQSDPS